MKAPDEVLDEAMKVEKSLLQLVEESEENEVYDKLRIFSSLTQFQIKIFKGEPKLVSQIILKYYAPSLCPPFCPSFPPSLPPSLSLSLSPSFSPTPSLSATCYMM